jgi:hypothetical protein
MIFQLIEKCHGPTQYNFNLRTERLQRGVTDNSVLYYDVLRKWYLKNSIALGITIFRLFKFNPVKLTSYYTDTGNMFIYKCEPTNYFNIMGDTGMQSVNQ